MEINVKLKYISWKPNKYKYPTTFIITRYLSNEKVAEWISKEFLK